MALELVGGLAHVLCGTATHPVLDKVVLCPVAQDGRKLELQHAARHPCLGRRTSHGIADKSHGHLQTVLKHASEVVCYGGEARCSTWGTLRPLGGEEVLQMVQRVKHRGIPLHGVGAPTSLHVEKTYVGIAGQGDVLLACSRLVEHELHVGLAGAEPYLASHHVIVYKFLLASLYLQGIGTTGLQGREGHVPLAVCICRGAQFLPCYGQGYLFSGICHALDEKVASVL